MKHILFILFISFQLQALAHRENTYFLQGNLGDTPIGLRMDEFGEKCFVRYFDLQNKADRYLEGDIEPGGKFHLYLINRDDQNQRRDTTEHLVLSENLQHRWQGTYTFEDGTQAEVVLSPIELQELNHPFAAQIERYAQLNLTPYSAYRSLNMTFIPEKTEKIGKQLKIQWYREKETGIRHFRIVSKHPQDVEEMNKYLAAEHIKLTELRYSCLQPTHAQAFTSSVEVYYLSEHFVSYRLRYQTDCMNMGKEQQTELTTFYIPTATDAMLEDVVWFGEGEARKLRDGSQEWYQYRYKEFGQKVLQLMEENHPKEMANTENGCDYKNLKRWQFPKWYLTEKGVFLEGYSLMEGAACRNTPWSVLPWKKLKDYLVLR